MSELTPPTITSPPDGTSLPSTFPLIWSAALLSGDAPTVDQLGETSAVLNFTAPKGGSGTYTNTLQTWNGSAWVDGAVGWAHGVTGQTPGAAVQYRGKQSDGTTTVYTDSTTVTFAPSIRFSDAFTATNGTNNAGRSPATNNTGNTWVSQSGTWQITGNRLQPSGSSPGTQPLWLTTFDPGRLQGVLQATVRCLSTATSASGLVVRYKDLNNLLMVSLNPSTNTVNVWERVAGVWGSAGTPNASYSATIGTTDHTLKLILDGPYIHVLFDGAILGAYRSNTFQAYSTVGVRCDAINLEVDDCSFTPLLRSQAANEVLDTFTAANGTNPSGRSGDTNTTGNNWVTSAGTWQITGNRLQTTGTAPAAPSWLLTRDIGKPDGILKTTVRLIAGAGTQGILFRYTDASNFWLFGLQLSTNTAYLFRRQAGSFTIANSVVLSSLGTTDHTLAVTFLGGVITCYVDDVVVIGHANSFNMDATKVGLRADGAAADVEFDSFHYEMYPVVDLFEVSGQSNASGFSESTDVSASTKPMWGTAFELNPDAGTLRQLFNPVALSQSRGSAWPAFGAEYYALTSRRPMIFQTSWGGSAMAAAADDGSGDWDLGGERYTIAVDNFAAAQAWLRSRGIAGIFRGVLWSQGEKDAAQIDAAVITKATYKAALVAMIARFRALHGSTMPFYIYQTGRPLSADTTGFVQVRAAQQEVVDADPYTFMVFTDAVNFPGASKQHDTYHYTLAGYNQMGHDSAAPVAAAIAPTPTSADITYEADHAEDGGAWSALFSGDAASPSSTIDSTSWSGDESVIRLRARNTSTSAVSDYDTASYFLSDVLAAADATHGHAADSVALTVAGTLAPQDATQGHAADSPTLTQANVLVVADALHGQSADSPAPGAEATLTVADTFHSQRAGSAVTPIYVEITRPLYFSEEIYVGSAARVWVPGIDRSAGTDDTMDPALLTVRVWRPDGTELDPAPEVGIEDGVPYLDFDPDVLNQAVTWKAQGFADGFKSRPITWKVLRNPR